MEQKYLSGFGNYFESEAKPGALPIARNNPQKAPFGLYAEQVTGSAFTAPRKENLRTWLYKMRPSVVQSKFEKFEHVTCKTGPFEIYDPNQFRWKPFEYPKQNLNFIESLTTYVGTGSPLGQQGLGIHMYACTKSMENTYFYSADGDFLLIPQEGELIVATELGVLEVAPTEICVIPKGIKFKVDLKGSKARGYAAENYGAHFIIPDLGPIGANGLANPRDFLTPHASFENKEVPCTLITKFMGQFYHVSLNFSPLDTVAWHGNYVPFKYDLKRFNTMNTVSYDHPDPSIFTVITSPSGAPGVANIDFVIFPSRWMVAEDTFRPPYYHRNVMSEFMGLIEGVYDAKSDEFAPGGASLHNAMSSHGPDAGTFEKASNAELKPERYKNTLAFMLETRWPYAVTEQALKSPQLDKDYMNCWQGLKRNFK